MLEVCNQYIYCVYPTDFLKKSLPLNFVLYALKLMFTCLQCVFLLLVCMHKLISYLIYTIDPKLSTSPYNRLVFIVKTS